MSEVTRHILIAEDNEVLRELLRFHLERAGFQITTASNGDAALKALADAAFDLLVTDYQMPGVDGGELCRRIREEMHNWQLPIMMVSAKGLELDVDDLQTRLQVTKVFLKPFSVRDIVASTKQLCAAGSASVPT